MDIHETASLVTVIQFCLEPLFLLGYISKINEGTDKFSLSILNNVSRKVYAFMFLSFSCALVVNVAYLWSGMFGAYVSDKDIYQYIAAQLTVPSLLLLKEAFGLYFGEEAKEG